MCKTLVVECVKFIVVVSKIFLSHALNTLH